MYRNEDYVLPSGPQNLAKEAKKKEDNFFQTQLARIIDIFSKEKAVNIVLFTQLKKRNSLIEFSFIINIEPL